MIISKNGVFFWALSVFILLFSCSGVDPSKNQEEDVASTTSAIKTEGHAWTHGDWSSRVVWEARHALSQSANDLSSFTYGSGKDQKWYGDWDYVANDGTARDKTSTEASGIVGTLSPTLSVNGFNVYRGGWCTYFVRLVLYRATSWAFSDHYTTPNYPISNMYTVFSPPMTQNFASVQPGWVLFTPTNQHYAIADKRETVGGQIGWWFIDSNYICSFCIGKHFMTDAQLTSLGYWGWLPDRGTNNN